jgi:hypothetical protein
MADEDRNYLELCGFEYKPEEIEKIMALQPMPVMMATDIGIKDSGKGKEVFLFEVERRLTGKVRPPHNQTIGDCVSHGVTGAAEDLQFVQMSRTRASSSSGWPPRSPTGWPGSRSGGAVAGVAMVRSSAGAWRPASSTGS